MRVEISIAKDKNLPKGAPEALQEEMTRRLSRRYEGVEVIVKRAGSDGLSIFRVIDKDDTKSIVEETLKDAWESADDWFY